MGGVAWKPFVYYHLLRHEILARVPSWARTVLDVGCGSGVLGAALKAQDPTRTVIGVEINEEIARVAGKVLDEVIVGDACTVDIFIPPAGYDVIILADVIEHVSDPWSLLRRLSAMLSRRGVVIISVPNLRNIYEISRILDGTWNYQSAGIFDVTHLRFFTVARLKELLRSADLEPYDVYLKPDQRLRVSAGTGFLPRDLCVGNLTVTGLLPTEIEELSAYQIVMAATRRACGHENGPMVSVVVPTRRDGNIEDLVQSLVRQAGALPFEVVLGLLEGEEPHIPIGVGQDVAITLVDCSRSAGLAGGLNLAASAASGNVLAFVEADVRLGPDWLRLLSAQLDDGSIAAAGGLVYDELGKLEAAAGLIREDGSVWLWDGSTREGSDPPRVVEVHFVSSRAFVVRASAFWAAGGFDERLPWGPYVDAALCLRLRRMGKRVVLDREAAAFRSKEALAKCTNRPASSSSLAPIDGPPPAFLQEYQEMLAEMGVPSSDVGSGDCSWQLVPPLRNLVAGWNAGMDRYVDERTIALVQLLKAEGHEVVVFAGPSRDEGHRLLGSLARAGVPVIRCEEVGGTSASAVERLQVLLGSLEPNVCWIGTGVGWEAVVKQLSSLGLDGRIILWGLKPEVVQAASRAQEQGVRIDSLVILDGFDRNDTSQRLETRTRVFHFNPYTSVQLDEESSRRRSVLARKELRRILGRTMVSRALKATSGNRVFVSIVVPVHDQREYVERCVVSVVTRTRVPFELVLVDNASGRDTASYLESLTKRHANVRVIRNERNTGYPFACNQGLSIAGGDYFVVLNSDTVVTEGWAERLIAPGRYSKVGVIAPVTNNTSGPQCIDVPYGEDMGAMHAFADGLRQDRAYQGFFCPRVTGFCLAIKREVVEQIGGFDPLFRIGNYEDDDFCLRAQLAGFRIWVAQDTFVHHYGNRTFQGEALDYTKLLEDNFEVFKAKWGLPPSWSRARGVPWQSLLERTFDPEWHHCPLSPAELAQANVGGLPLVDRRRVHFLMVPNWRDPEDRWREAIEAFVFEFSPEEDVGLLIRVDPLEHPEPWAVTRLVDSFAVQRGLQLGEGRLVLVLMEKVPPLRRASIYRTSDYLIDTARPGSFAFTTAEAEACGLQAIPPTREALRSAYEQASRRKTSFERGRSG